MTWAFFPGAARTHFFLRLEVSVMKRFVLSLMISSIVMLPLSAVADHPPKRLLRNFLAFSALGETGKLGKFDVNVTVYGALPKGKTTTKDNPALDKIFADRFNFAAIVMKGDEAFMSAITAKKGLIAIFLCSVCR